jgi:predicted alpha/beta-fold hydrolase
MPESLQDTRGDIEDALKTTSTWQFNELFTRRAFGFKNPEEYYNTVSCRHVLDGIAIPTMSISALDDPVIILTAFLTSPSRTPTHSL